MGKAKRLRKARMKAKREKRKARRLAPRFVWAMETSMYPPPEAIQGLHDFITQPSPQTIIVAAKPVIQYLFPNVTIEEEDD